MIYMKYQCMRVNTCVGGKYFLNQYDFCVLNKDTSVVGINTFWEDQYLIIHSCV
jgi:hypothetical protein